jgi:hypothetical protein
MRHDFCQDRANFGSIGEDGAVKHQEGCHCAQCVTDFDLSAAKKRLMAVDVITRAYDFYIIPRRGATRDAYKESVLNVGKDFL